MKLFRWAADPFAGLGQLQSEMRDVFGKFNRMLGPRQTTPLISVTQDESGLTVLAEVPGVQPGDISIDVEGDSLKLGVKRDKPEGIKDEQYHRRDRRFGEFVRELRLPAGLDTENVDAKLANGILTVHLPKAEEAKPRTIEVKAG